MPRVLMTLAVAAAALLLAADLRWMAAPAHVYLSALPLALAGIGYAVLQIVLRPDRVVFLKRLLLAITFVAWAVAQMLPTGIIATFLGDLVIAAFVLDLYWIVKEQSG